MKSLEELKAIKDRLHGEMHIRDEDPNRIKVVVGMGTCGIAAGARPVVKAIADAVLEKGLSDKVIVTISGCTDECQFEPVVKVYEPGKEVVTYVNMTADKGVEVVESHFVGGKVVDAYIK